MAVQKNCKIIEHTKLQNTIYCIVLEAPQIVQQIQCGQFLHIACGEGHLLRRPISICTWHENFIQIVFQVKGKGTQWLAERKVGDTLDVLGPLGHGFDLSFLGNRPIFIGGGIGVPPMLACVQQAAHNQTITPRTILGFRNQDAVILEDDFQSVCETFITTDDGSYARAGFVTDVLAEQITDATGIAVCGPRPMLKAIAQAAQKYNIPCQVSLEERMGCGVGACLVCACALHGENGMSHYGHVCKDGPVFDAKEVVW